MFKLFQLPPPARWKPGHAESAALNRQLWRLVVFLTAVVGLGAIFQRVPTLVQKLDNADLGSAIYLGILFAMPVAGAMWGRQAWHTADLWESAPGASHNPLILRAVTIIGMVGMAVFVVAHCFAAPTQVRVLHARQIYNQYSLVADPVAGVIHISGPIGPNLASKLDTALSRAPSIRAIEITSAGGLIEESRRAATVIERHANVTVIARETCNSACLPLVLAGARRYADWDMNLGVGQVRAVTDMPRAVDQNRVIQTALDVDRYFADKGLPQNMRYVVRSANARGLISESAIRLAEARVITGVMNGTQPISLAEAKWRMVERHLEQSDEIGLREILRAGRDAGSSFVESHAEAIYAALLTNDADQLRNSVCGLAAPLTALHIRSYAESSCR